MGFVDSLSYNQLSKIVGCSAGALRQKAWRHNMTKAQAIADCAGASLEQILGVTNQQQLEDLFKNKKDMERRFAKSAFVTKPTVRQSVSQEDEEYAASPINTSGETVTKLPSVTMESETNETVTKSESDVLQTRVSHLETKLKEPAAEVVTFIKSDILSVTAMLILSVLIAVSFTAKIFIASGVSAMASYIMSVLLDFTMIVFVFRGHTSIAWLFGVNIFFQVALTTSAKMFLTWMPESTIIGIKGLLVAISIVIAIKGLSDYVQKNFK